jgi:hypothetical protein
MKLRFKSIVSLWIKFHSCDQMTTQEVPNFVFDKGRLEKVRSSLQLQNIAIIAISESFMNLDNFDSNKPLHPRFC